jgi:hypothetical protein
MNGNSGQIFTASKKCFLVLQFCLFFFGASLGHSEHILLLVHNKKIYDLALASADSREKNH